MGYKSVEMGVIAEEICSCKLCLSIRYHSYLFCLGCVNLHKPTCKHTKYKEKWGIATFNYKRKCNSHKNQNKMDIKIKYNQEFCSLYMHNHRVCISAY